MVVVLKKLIVGLNLVPNKIKFLLLLLLFFLCKLSFWREKKKMGFILLLLWSRGCLHTIQQDKCPSKQYGFSVDNFYQVQNNFKNTIFILFMIFSTFIYLSYSFECCPPCFLCCKPRLQYSSTVIPCATQDSSNLLGV